MIRRKPDQAVCVLLARLNEAKTCALARSDNDNSLVSNFKGIEDKLESMKKLYPNIKFLEKTATDKFCELEQRVYDYHETEDENKMLREHVKNLEKLNEMIDNLQVAQIGTKDPGEKLNKPEQSAPTPTEDKAMSEWWKNLKIEEKISESEAMSSLLASFRNLENFQVKMCLMFLSVFPESSVIKKKPIIYWWIGEGVVTKNGTGTAEEVGEQVFQQLLNQGFIKQYIEDNNSITVKSFIVHPWIRRMLILAAKENNFLEFSTDGSRTPLNNARRAFSCGGNENDLLTVFNVEEQILRIKSEWLSKLKKVEVLQLGRWRNSAEYHIEVQKKDEKDELLKGLGPQKHLKYLSLRGISLIETLPDSIANLFSLEILDLRACHNLDRLPLAVTKLVNLTHLDVSECYLLESMPKGLEHLRSLQVLKGFVIGKEWKNSCRIRDLSRQLTKLRKLSIRVNINDDGAQGQLSQLDDNGFPDLQILTISWGVKISSKPSEFSFPTILNSLRKLDLRCPPEWMLQENLPNLKTLYITGGDLKSAPKGSGTVKLLRFKYLKSFSVAEKDLLQRFPNYERCEIIECNGQSHTFLPPSPSPSNNRNMLSS